MPEFLLTRAQECKFKLAILSMNPETIKEAVITADELDHLEADATSKLQITMIKSGFKTVMIECDGKNTSAEITGDRLVQVLVLVLLWFVRLLLDVCRAARVCLVLNFRIPKHDGPAFLTAVVFHPHTNSSAMLRQMRLLSSRRTAELHYSHLSSIINQVCQSFFPLRPVALWPVAFRLKALTLFLDLKHETKE